MKESPQGLESFKHYAIINAFTNKILLRYILADIWSFLSYVGKIWRVCRC